MTDKDKKPSLAVAGLAGAIGGASATQVPSHLLGYHKVYHGTSKERAAAILKGGLKPSHGGSGASQHGGEGSHEFIAGSKGKVHVTKGKDVAKDFAGITQHKRQDMPGGQVLKARVTHRHWESMKVDEHGGGMKDISATTHHKIPASQIQGGAGHKGIRGVVNKGTLKHYYKSSSGRARAAQGLVHLGVTALGGGLVARALKARMEKKHD